VDGQDGRPLGLVGQRDLDLAVEAPGPQQRRVQHLGTVGGGQDDHHPVEGSKPSISARSWLRVCSRSSLETIDPPRR
jgi:hypothetical protein